MGECFFGYRATRVVSDQRPLNGCVCVQNLEPKSKSEVRSSNLRLKPNSSSLLLLPINWVLDESLV